MKKLLIPFLAILLFSCSDDDETQGGGGVRATDCRILKSVSYYNNDTINQSEINFFYSGDLLTKTTRGNRFNLYDSTFFVYNKDNKQSFNLEFNPSTGRLDTSEIFEYDQTGNLVKLSLFYNNMLELEYTFIYSNNLLTELKLLGDNLEIQRVELQSDSKGNILKYWALDSLGKRIPGERGQFEYDNNRNPYQNIYSEETGIVEMLASNNVTRSIFYDSDQLDFSSSTSYIYDRFGLPITSLTTDSDGDVMKVNYSYECF